MLEIDFDQLSRTVKVKFYEYDRKLSTLRTVNVNV